MGSFTRLEELYRLRCPLLTALPEDLGDLPHLRSLTLLNLPSLQDLPRSLCNARKLTHMEVREERDCVNLRPPSEKHLPPNLCGESRIRCPGFTL